MGSFIQMRIDNEIKKGAENIVKRLGMSLSEAIRLFLMQMIIHQGIPFELSLKVTDAYEPNERLRQAIADANAKKGLSYYQDTDEMWRDLGW